MRANAGRIDRHVLGIGFQCQSLENPREYATLAPAAVALMDALAVAKALGQVPPGNSGPVAVDDGIDEQAIVGGRPPDVTFAAWQEILDLDPLIVAQSMAVHLSASLLPTTHESEKM